VLFEETFWSGVRKVKGGYECDEEEELVL
jgi:hypothetical protein